MHKRSECTACLLSRVHIPGRPDKGGGHFVLWSVSLEIMIRSAPNLAQIKVTSL